MITIQIGITIPHRDSAHDIFQQESTTAPSVGAHLRDLETKRYADVLAS